MKNKLNKYVIDIRKTGDQKHFYKWYVQKDSKMNRNWKKLKNNVHRSFVGNIHFEYFRFIRSLE